MKRSRSHVSPTVPTPFAGPIDTEQLENRRLFAGVVVPSFVAFAPPESAAAYVMTHARPRATMAWQSPAFGRPMLVVAETGRVTAASAVTTAALSANARSTATSTTTGSFATPVAVPTGTAAASLTRSTAMATATTTTTEDAGVAVLVRQAETSPVAVTVTRSTDAATAPDQGGRVFGPFTLAAPAVPSAASSAASVSSSGLSNLLDLNERATATARRWADPTQAAARPRRAAGGPDVDAAAGELPIIVSAGRTPEQATLAAIAGDPAARPLWQRLGLATAGVALVAANWFVRRRDRRQATGIR